MQIGIIGLGRMGAGMARRLAEGGMSVLCYDQADAARQALSGVRNLECAENLAALCAKFDGERVVLLMLPAGAAVEDTIRDLIPLMSSGDTIVDGGNSYYRDSMRRALALSQQGLRYIDAGVSGGIHGREQGYCLMLGGTPPSIEIFAPAAKLLAPHAENGWLHCGPSGAGHFAKMVHNGIEYGMMQAYAEGYELMAASPLLDNVAETFKSWQQGTVIRSWLLDLAVLALQDDPKLSQLRGYAADSGEGRWTVEAAIDNAVPMPVITAALFARFASRQEDSPAMKMVAALRNQFGGHAVEAIGSVSASQAISPGASASPAS